MQLLVTAAALAQTVGNAVVAAYQRSSMLELRRPVLQKWADFICPTDNVVPIKRGAARSRSLSPPRGVGRDCLHPAAGLCGLNPGGLASGVFPRQTSLPSAIGIAPMASTLSGKTLFITGASRGIGLAIGLKAARDGANVVIAAKTAEPHPKLPGTIFSAAAEIEKAGGKALPLTVDVRDEAQVRAALDKTVAMFGGVDIVVNNASDFADRFAGDRHEALRSHASDQCTRHVHGVEVRSPVP